MLPLARHYDGIDNVNIGFYPLSFRENPTVIVECNWEDYEDS